MTYYPDVEDAVRVHAKLIAMFGGTPGIRDRGALEVALTCARIGQHEDLTKEAGALWEGLLENRPFHDGNKRLAVTIATAFLRTNGFLLQFNDIEVREFSPRPFESR